MPFITYHKNKVYSSIKYLFLSLKNHFFCVMFKRYWYVMSVSYPGEGECTDPVNEDAIMEGGGGGGSQDRSRERQLASDTGEGKT
jgi:hypothetical protein